MVFSFVYFRVPKCPLIRVILFQIVTSLVVPENIIHTLKELADTLKHALQIKELNELISSVINYIELVWLFLKSLLKVQ